MASLVDIIHERGVFRAYHNFSFDEWLPITAEITDNHVVIRVQYTTDLVPQEDVDELNGEWYYDHFNYLEGFREIGSRFDINQWVRKIHRNEIPEDLSLEGIVRKYKVPLKEATRFVQGRSNTLTQIFT